MLWATVLGILPPAVIRGSREASISRAREIGSDRILLHDGEQSGPSLELASICVVTTPTAKRVDEVHRTLRVVGDTMTYDVSMAAVGEKFQHHLNARLERNGE